MTKSAIKSEPPIGSRGGSDQTNGRESRLPKQSKAFLLRFVFLVCTPSAKGNHCGGSGGTSIAASILPRNDERFARGPSRFGESEIGAPAGVAARARSASFDERAPRSLRGGAAAAAAAALNPFPSGYNPFGHRLTDLGKGYLDFDGSLDSDVGRFLSTLKGGRRKTAAAMKEQWLEIVRVSKKAQSMRIYRKLDDLIEFCLKAGFIDQRPGGLGLRRIAGLGRGETPLDVEGETAQDRGGDGRPVAGNCESLEEGAEHEDISNIGRPD